MKKEGNLNTARAAKLWKTNYKGHGNNFANLNGDMSDIADKTQALFENISAEQGKVTITLDYATKYMNKVVEVFNEEMGKREKQISDFCTGKQNCPPADLTSKMDKVKGIIKE